MQHNIKCYVILWEEPNQRPFLTVYFLRQFYIAYKTNPNFVWMLNEYCALQSLRMRCCFCAMFTHTEFLQLGWTILSLQEMIFSVYLTCTDTLLTKRNNECYLEKEIMLHHLSGGFLFGCIEYNHSPRPVKYLFDKKNFTYCRFNLF